MEGDRQAKKVKMGVWGGGGGTKVTSQKNFFSD